ncbi:hypothetical protein VNO80_02616 [Phaseolus coccineus]|uniref:Uncharacterized protein n=1 Tax=Phaseolus coccineus TaxID=3886 RepID=A0AAN9RI43_PHACN
MAGLPVSTNDSKCIDGVECGEAYMSRFRVVGGTEEGKGKVHEGGGSVGGGGVCSSVRVEARVAFKVRDLACDLKASKEGGCHGWRSSWPSGCFLCRQFSYRLEDGGLCFSGSAVRSKVLGCVAKR